MQAQLPSYKAPFLSPARAGLLNRLCGFAGPFRTAFGAGHAVWEPVWDVPVFSPAASLDIQCGINTWTALLSDASCLLRHEALVSETAAFSCQELPEEVRCAVLSALFSAVLAEVSPALGMPFAVRGVQLAPTAEFQPAFGFKIRLEGCPGIEDQHLFVALVPSHPEAMLLLEKKLAELPCSGDALAVPALCEVPLEVAFESGYLTVSMNDIDALEQGDVLVPEAWIASQGKVLLRLARSFAPALTASCLLTDGKAEIEEPLSAEVEPVMDSEHNDIDIRLSFELDRRSITVGELPQLAPGYVFKLNGDMQAPVTVRANGKTIAQGRIVDMDGTLGVQLTRML